MRLSIQKRTIIFIVFFAALSAAILAFVVWPAIQHIRELRDQTYQLRLFLEKKYERSSRLHNSLEIIQSLKKTTANYSNHEFNKGDELKLVTALEKIAESNGVEQNVDTSNFAVTSGQMATMSLTISGRYGGAMQYVADLESRVPYFVNVETLTISPNSNRQNLAAGNGDMVTLHLELSIYVQ